MIPYVHLKTDADPDPDPAYHFDADPDPTFQFDTDPDPQHRFKVSGTFHCSIVVRIPIVKIMPIRTGPDPQHCLSPSEVPYSIVFRFCRPDFALPINVFVQPVLTKK